MKAPRDALGGLRCIHPRMSVPLAGEGLTLSQGDHDRSRVVGAARGEHRHSDAQCPRADLADSKGAGLGAGVDDRGELGA